MAYDYAKLNGRIVEKCGTQAVFAERMGLSERTISMKLNNKIAFKQPEIQKALEVLDLASDEIQAYFFYHESSKRLNQQKGGEQDEESNCSVY